MVRRRTLLLRLVVPATLVMLMGVLAALEYRWLGEVSKADRSRRKASLQQHAEEFSNDFDRELLRVYIVLQSLGGSLEAPRVEAFAKRVDSWRETAREPRIVQSFFVIDNDPTKTSIHRYDDGARGFVDEVWPATLQPVRDRITAHFPSPTGPDQAVYIVRDPVMASVPALITGPVMFNGRFGIALLDGDVIRNVFLPALANRYFPARDDDEYRLAIVDVRNGDQPVLSRGFPNGTVIADGQADARVPMFSLRLDLAPQISRFLVTRETTASASIDEFRINVPNGAPRANAVRPMPTSPSVGASARSGGAGGRGAGTMAAAAGALGAIADANRVAAAGLQIMVTGDPQGPPADVVSFTTRMPMAAWQLSLQHVAGSLDAAVDQARRRNLWLSFGILGVLGIGMGLVVLNAQRSQRLAAQQMDFVATVSHELRTPLAVIRSAAQNLSAGVVADSTQARKYGEVIDAEGRRLTDMVEQVLEYAGLSAGRRPVAERPLDLGALARDVVQSSEPLIPSEDFEVEVTVAENLPPVVADEGAIRRAVQNLMTNALKYGADGRWLGVDVRRGTWRGRDEVHVTVRDRGRGIDPADLPHVFEAFYRGRRAVDEQIHGNGLGLSLVKRIVEAHDGRVTVKSSPGEGTAFTLHLPATSLAPAAQEHETDAPSLGHPASGRV